MSSTTARSGGSASCDERADALLERVGGGEEQAAVQAHDAMPGNVSSPGFSISVAEHLRARLAAEQRHPRRGGDVDEPDERERDADHDAGQHAGREHGDDRRGRDPEVEALDPVQAPQLGDVDHPEDDRVDDDRARAPPSAGREKSGASATRVRITSPPVTSDAIGVRAPADSLSELADRLVETGIPWKTPEAALAMPCATDSWLTSMR